jgi:inositol transporter-like SP family MFS transporter
MASYLDAGSIVALGAGLALWQEELGMGSSAVGLLAAIGPNAAGAALGAFVGGHLGDRLGRKRIYQYDLLLYAAGILCIVFAANAAMLFAGTVIVAIAVGADVPTSLALVGEFSPAKARGKLLGSTQVAWSLGPVVVLFLALALSSLDLLGIRIVFAHLFVVAMLTWWLRRGLSESRRWTEAAEDDSAPAAAPRELLRRPHITALLFTGSVYLTWNLAAGTNGIFLPYILRTVGSQSQAASVALQSASFVLTAVFTVFVFMRFTDRGYTPRRVIWAVGAVLQVTAFVLFLVLPFTTPVAMANIALFGIGAALAGEAFYKVWSQELFPTLLRGTAQGITFGTARVALGVWSFFVPVLAETGIRPVAALLTAFLAISGVIGFFFMPRTAGRSLEDIEEERSVTTDPAPDPAR